MMFSKSCEYAIKAVIYLCMATKDGQRLSTSEIAGTIELPDPLTVKTTFHVRGIEKHVQHFFEVYSQVCQIKIDNSALMGFTGAIYKQFFGSSLGLVYTAGVMLLWIILPLIISVRIFKRKNL